MNKEHLIKIFKKLLIFCPIIGLMLLVVAIIKTEIMAAILGMVFIFAWRIFIQTIEQTELEKRIKKLEENKLL